MNDLSLKVSRLINAPAKAIYEAWLTPETLSEFMHPAPNVKSTQVSTDPKPGGRFSILMIADGQEIPHSGIYKTLTPYSQLVFTWNSPFSADDSTVTINLKEVAEGTQVELLQVKFPSEESRDNHEGGWAAILACLGQALQETTTA